MEKKPRTIIIRNTEPENMAMAIHVVTAGLDGKEKLPVLFDYEMKDKEKRAKKMLLSFVVYDTKQGLVVKRVKGKERKKYLDRVQN